MFLLVDKPKGITSHDVIDMLRRVTGIKKIGHAGTLDPNATGLLIVGITRSSTKKLGALTTETSKVYEAEVYLGEERDTDDVEGKTTQVSKIVPSLDEVNRVLDLFKGEQEQMPPAYSAIKLQGKKAYELARKGEKVDIKKRNILVHSIELLNYDYPSLSLRTHVSSGTYIRSLARDIGRDLKTCGYLNNLRRTQIDTYSIEDAVPLDKITSDNWEQLAVEL